MISFALLVAPLPIVAAALLSASKRKGCNSPETSNNVAEIVSLTHGNGSMLQK